MFKAAFREYALVYILEYGKSCPNYNSAFPFSLFPTMFSAQSWTEITILETSNLSSAIAFNSVQPKILLFGKKLNEIKDYPSHVSVALYDELSLVSVSLFN